MVRKLTRNKKKQGFDSWTRVPVSKQEERRVDYRNIHRLPTPETAGLHDRIDNHTWSSALELTFSLDSPQINAGDYQRKLLDFCLRCLVYKQRGIY